MIEENYQIIDMDVYQLIKDMTQKWQELSGDVLTEANPETLIFKTVAKILGLIGEKQNDEVKQNYLRYSRGTRLDLYGEFFGNRGLRLQEQYSKTKMRIYISAIQPIDIVVLKGTRIFYGAYYFSTDEEIKISPGNLYADVNVTCSIPGTSTNEISVGNINNLVDVFSFYQKCENIETTSGGAEVESDENYRKRLYLIPESFSTAGPNGAYKFWALSANQTITDVSVTSLKPAEVDIYLLTENGLASQSIKDQVLNVLNDKTIRPLTDLVNVHDPVPVTYNVDLSYFVGKENEAMINTIKQNVEIEVRNFINWQQSVLGRDINPDELIKRLKLIGVKRIVITNPKFTPISLQEVAFGSVANVTYAGIEAD